MILITVPNYDLRAIDKRLFAGVILQRGRSPATVDYLPAGRYTVREWSKEGDFLTFSPSDNKEYHVTRKLLNTAL